MEKMIFENYPVVSVDKFSPTKFSPFQLEELNELGITIKALNRRYFNIDKRCKSRGAVPPNTRQFQRALVFAAKKLAAKTKLTPKEILDGYDIHSINLFDYNEFQLVPASIHRGEHNKSKIEPKFKCRYCNEVKPKSNFVFDKRTKQKIIRVCKTCDSILRKERKLLRGGK